VTRGKNKRGQGTRKVGLSSQGQIVETAWVRWSAGECGKKKKLMSSVAGRLKSEAGSVNTIESTGEQTRETESATRRGIIDFDPAKSG